MYILEALDNPSQVNVASRNFREETPSKFIQLLFHARLLNSSEVHSIVILFIIILP